MQPEPSKLFLALASAQWVVLILVVIAFSQNTRWALGLFLVSVAMGMAKSSWRYFSGNSGLPYFALGMLAYVCVGSGCAYALWLRTRTDTITTTEPNDGDETSDAISRGPGGPPSVT